MLHFAQRFWTKRKQVAIHISGAVRAFSWLHAEEKVEKAKMIWSRPNIYNYNRKIALFYFVRTEYVYLFVYKITSQ